MGKQQETLPERGNLRKNNDPTKTVLSQSALNQKYLCDYVLNVATGCSHGCRFCYVPGTPNIRARPDMLSEKVDVSDPQEEWGEYVLYRDDVPEKLPGILERKRKWRSTPGGQGIVGVSFHTDCYMDQRAGNITRDVVDILTDYDRYTRILTRNPLLATTDMDVYCDAGKYVTIGSSINSLNAEQVKAIEVNAPSPQARLAGLERFSEQGVQTYVSMSPTYPTATKEEIRELMESIMGTSPSVIFHEAINPRGKNFQMTVDAAWAAGEEKLGSELASLRSEDQWVKYSLKHLYWVQEIGIEMDAPVHLWPDKQLLQHIDGEYKDWINAWLERQSPERFAERPVPSSGPPKLPDIKPDMYLTSL